MASGDLAFDLAFGLVLEQHPGNRAVDAPDLKKARGEHVVVEHGRERHRGAGLKVGHKPAIGIGKYPWEVGLSIDQDLHAFLVAGGVLEAHHTADGDGGVVYKINAGSSGIAGVDVDEALTGQKQVGNFLLPIGHDGVRSLREGA